MKLLFDLFPVILFFLAYAGAKRMPDTASAWVSGLLTLLAADSHVAAEQGPILLATVVTIFATMGQVAWLLARRKPVDKMLWLSLTIIVLMGGATVLLRDPTFIKWKPTVLYWAFGAVLLGSQLILGKNLIRSALGQQLRLPDQIWPRVNLSWVGFFLLMGALNLYVAYNFSESTWVDFKLFGSTGLMLVFVVLQGMYLSRFAEAEEGK
jgi:intracellular septation protein